MFLFFALGSSWLQAFFRTQSPLAFPELIVRILFGPAYVSIAPMLWLLAVATTLYSLSNVVINYRLSTGFTHGSLIAVVAGMLQVMALLVFHNSLLQVVYVLILVNAVLFGALLAWDLWLSFSAKGREAPKAAP